MRLCAAGPVARRSDGLSVIAAIAGSTMYVSAVQHRLLRADIFKLTTNGQ